MIIDFHTHIFPDELAPRAMYQLSASINYIYTPVSDGTVSGLLQNMDDWGVDLSVVQPVVTNESQMRKVNEWVAGIRSERLVCFGSIYPLAEDYKSAIDFVAALGLKGLKFHPEYQDFIVDDRRMLRIYDYALSKGLILLFHAGYDPAFSPPYRSSPQQFAHIEEEMRGGVLIAAHLGGHDQWDDVESCLAGRNIYLDTSMGFEYFPHDQFVRIVRRHGADKILFASDAPWSNAQTEKEQLMALAIPDEEKDMILGGNAKRLLGI